jgi:hypothetical protein
MPPLTLGQFAKAAGVSKSYTSKLIKNGTISAQKQPNGQYHIDPSELDRIPRKQSENTSQERLDTPPVDWEGERKALVALVNTLNDQLQDIREDRDHWRTQAERLLLTPPRTPQRSWWRRFFSS